MPTCFGIVNKFCILYSIIFFLDFPGGKSWISVQLNELLTRSFIRESLTPNKSIQNIVETETRAIVDMAAGRRIPPQTV